MNIDKHFFDEFIDREVDLRIHTSYEGDPSIPNGTKTTADATLEPNNIKAHCESTEDVILPLKASGVLRKGIHWVEVEAQRISMVIEGDNLIAEYELTIV
jgi:hypothetical protein